MCGQQYHGAVEAAECQHYRDNKIQHCICTNMQRSALGHE